MLNKNRSSCLSMGLTEPGLLITLDLDGQSEVGQLDGGTLLLARQQQVLRLETKQMLNGRSFFISYRACFSTTRSGSAWTGGIAKVLSLYRAEVILIFCPYCLHSRASITFVDFVSPQSAVHVLYIYMPDSVLRHLVPSSGSSPQKVVCQTQKQNVDCPVLPHSLLHYEMKGKRQSL